MVYARFLMGLVDLFLFSNSVNHLKEKIIQKKEYINWRNSQRVARYCEMERGSWMMMMKESEIRQRKRKEKEKKKKKNKKCCLP